MGDFGSLGLLPCLCCLALLACRPPCPACLPCLFPACPACHALFLPLYHLPYCLAMHLFPHACPPLCIFPSPTPPPSHCPYLPAARYIPSAALCSPLALFKLLGVRFDVPPFAPGALVRWILCFLRFSFCAFLAFALSFHRPSMRMTFFTCCCCVLRG